MREILNIDERFEIPCVSIRLAWHGARAVQTVRQTLGGDLLDAGQATSLHHESARPFHWR